MGKNGRQVDECRSSFSSLNAEQLENIEFQTSLHKLLPQLILGNAE